MWPFFNSGLHLGHIQRHPWDMKCSLTVLFATEVPICFNLDLSSPDMTVGLIIFYLSNSTSFESKTLKLVYYVAAKPLIIQWIADLRMSKCFVKAPYPNFNHCQAFMMLLHGLGSVVAISQSAGRMKGI